MGAKSRNPGRGYQPGHGGCVANPTGKGCVPNNRKGKKSLFPSILPGNTQKRPSVGQRTNLSPSEEVRYLALRLLDDEYWERLRDRLRDGSCPPAIEGKILAYAYGEPRQAIHIDGVSEMAKALTTKVIDELHPGPSRGPAGALPAADLVKPVVAAAVEGVVRRDVSDESLDAD